MKHHSYLLCVSNEGYPASLEERKLYEHIPDASAENRRLVRVVDESGEDYLYPAKLFVPVSLPQSVVEALERHRA